MTPKTDSKTVTDSQKAIDSQPGRDEVSTVGIGPLAADGAASQGPQLPPALLDRVRLSVSVELGRTELTFRELQNVTQGAIVELDHMVGDPLDILANGHLIARGEVVSIKDERYGIRVTEVVRQDANGRGEGSQ